MSAAARDEGAADEAAAEKASADAAKAAEEEAARLMEEKLAAEKAAEEATVKAVLSSDDYEHSDNSTEGEHEREDKDEVLLESTSTSVTSSIASMSM